MRKAALHLPKDASFEGFEQPSQRCLNCGWRGMFIFYAVEDIPVHSSLLMSSREKAIRHPRGKLRLGFCRSCGFISNTQFDSSVQEYSIGYEDQQSFSPRFREFQKDLITRLIERYNVRDKDVVEIGCGKGDFLIELCQTGGNRGIGIDPACDPERVGSRDAGRVRFIPAFYSEAHGNLPCDFFCCRHTLEHIHSTNDFIRLMRKTVGDRKDVVVFFEVPDVGRVLRERAFWDIQYEHCSYLSLGSLARVFRANCFDIVELAKGFDDQYLLIVARATEDLTSACLPEEDDLEQLTTEVENFTVDVQACIGQWRSRLGKLRKGAKRAAIWGSGSKCVSFLSAVCAGDEVDAIVDINPYRHGKFLPGSGKQVVAPERLRTLRPDVIFVMNPIYRDEIRQAVDRMGLDAELLLV